VFVTSSLGSHYVTHPEVYYKREYVKALLREIVAADSIWVFNKLRFVWIVRIGVLCCT